MLVKNALEYIEDLAGDVRPYLEDRIVGIIALAHRDQARAGAVQALRGVVHALRAGRLRLRRVSPTTDAPLTRRQDPQRI
ncbi:hypothetical protein GGC65_002404 [Sphingopyxis sp. OAS728]|nr:hypothetical protein [Sphingopyxis sp. OAS728]